MQYGNIHKETEKKTIYFVSLRFSDSSKVNKIFIADLVTIIKALHETCNCKYHLQAGVILRLEKNGLPNFTERD